MEHEILLDVRHLTHIFPLSRKTAVKAVDDVSFQIRRGEIFGLVGESGSGKSTAARCVMNIYQPYAGQIYYKGIDTCDRGQFRKNKKNAADDTPDDFSGFRFQSESENEGPRHY